MQQILLNFVLMSNNAIQKFSFFVFMGFAQLHAKMTCIYAQYHEFLNFVFLPNFAQKNVNMLIQFEHAQ